MSIPVADDPFGTTYCSKACQLASFASSHNVLFGNKTINLAPAENILSPAAEEERQKKRRQAQEAFAAHVKASGKLSPLITAKFFARMISNEIAKILPSDAAPPPPNDLPEPDDGAQHAFYDHMDRLRFLEVMESKAEDMETTLLKDMLDGAMPGLEEFIKDDRYLMLKGKALFNTIGVAYSGGRLNKVRSHPNVDHEGANLPLMNVAKVRRALRILGPHSDAIRYLASDWISILSCFIIRASIFRT